MPVDVPPIDVVADDLVVATEHRALVEAELARLQVRPDPSRTEVEDGLGLTLLRGLTGLAGRARVVRAAVGATEPVTDLDALLLGLRAAFADRYGGWVPDLGKNRMVASLAPDGPGRGKIMTATPLATMTVPPTTYIVEGPGQGKIMSFKTGRVSVVGTIEYALPDDLPPIKPPPIPAPGPGDYEPMVPPLPEPKYLALADLEGPREQRCDGVTIGIVDTELFEPNGADPADAYRGHATFVRGLVARAAPGATIELRPVLHRDTGTATAWDVAKAIAGLGQVDVLNLSLGCRTADGRPPLVLTRAIERLPSTTVVVAAAGNHGGGDDPSASIWPAAMSRVVAVGACDDDGQVAPFSPVLPWVSVLAPGVRVPGEFVTATVRLADGGTTDFDGAATWSGTSFAAATVSGRLAAAIAEGTPPSAALDAVVADSNNPVRRFTPPL